MVSVEAPVFENPDIMYSPIRLNEVIGDCENIIAIKIDGNTFLSLLRQSVRIDTNAVVKIGNVIVADHVALPVHFYRKIGSQRRRMIKSIPSGQGVGTMTPEHRVIGNVKILRFRTISNHRDTDVLNFAVLDG